MIPIDVSIIAHTRIFWSAAMSMRRAAISWSWPGFEIFGTRMPSGRGLGRGGEIVEPPLGVQRIDAHDHFARAEAAGRDRRPRPAGGPPPWRRAQPSPRDRGSPHRRAGSSPFPARAHWRRACKARCGADGWSCRHTPVAVGSDCTSNAHRRCKARTRPRKTRAATGSGRAETPPPPANHGIVPGSDRAGPAPRAIRTGV